MSARTILAEVAPFVAPDGSTVRELMRPEAHGSRNQSLAQAGLPPGGATRLHYHGQSEELYFIQQGEGRLRVGDEELPVAAGHTVLIRPGTHHRLENTGNEKLLFLCCCSPPYSDDDTFFP